MTRQQAIALVQYISRAHGMIATTGAEWDVIRDGLQEIEHVANGRGELKYVTPEQSKTELKTV